MATAQRKSRASMPVVLGDGGWTPERYIDEKTRKSAFTTFKFHWLRQVATDPSLPPAAAPIAIMIADAYLSQKDGDAWPSIETLAKQLGRKKTQTRAALQAMDGAHLRINWTAGGKGKTNRYRPILTDQTVRISGGLHGGDTEGTFASNPPENGAQTLRNSDRKPSEIPEGNPYEGIPLKEPRAGSPKATPAYVSRSRSTSVSIDDSDANASRASVVYSDGFNVGVEINLPGEGVVIISERVGDLMRARNICGELVSFKQEGGMFVIVERKAAR